MASKAVIKMNRSFRTGRKSSDKSKRYTPKEIKNFNDLRTFFYEYSLFVGDMSSLPGGPNIQFVNKTRHAFLKAGRVMGDAKAIGKTIVALSDGLHSSDFEGAGERYFRRFGGRTTGKVLMAIPGSNVFSRAARSVIGANMQKEFDKMTKGLFRGTAENSAAVAKTYGKINFGGLSANKKVQKIVEMVTEDIVRQAAPLTPVKTGKLRGSLRTELSYMKHRGGSSPVGEAKIGGKDIEYATKIEYGEGKGFDVGMAHTKRYFPKTPTHAQALRGNKTNRRAVNKDTKQGGMMRRGATLAIQRLKATGLGQVLTDTKHNPDFKAVIQQAMNSGKI